MTRRGVLGVLLATTAACAGGPPAPAPLDTRNDACAWCRMAVSDPRFAAQLVAPAEEPRFFDDIGCLAGYLRDAKPLPRGGRAYVTDHRTKAWVEAARAVYTKVPGLETPMASHLIAHADAASRDADAGAGPGSPLAPGAVFGSPLPAPVAEGR
ncbi:MAG TPA: nitrous oxide reductase accessory protein NosL [Vicinamibacteria bacterium]|nr:nitrous oxide reductase accessory protein NosL [Vicinamibacteria bacterium]